MVVWKAMAQSGHQGVPRGVTNQAAAMPAVLEISVGTNRWISSNVPEGLRLGREEGGLYFP